MNRTVILRKRAAPKVVNLPNGWSFTTKWERVSRKSFPISIRVKRQRTIGPRKNNRMIYLYLDAPAFRKIKARRKKEKVNRLEPVCDRINQSGKGLASNLIKAGLDLGSKAIGYEFGKKLIHKGIDNIPGIIKFGVSKIKNKNVQDALSSDIAEIVVDAAQNRANNNYTSLFD